MVCLPEELSCASEHQEELLPHSLVELLSHGLHFTLITVSVLQSLLLEPIAFDSHINSRLSHTHAGNILPIVHNAIGVIGCAFACLEL